MVPTSMYRRMSVKCKRGYVGDPSRREEDLTTGVILDDERRCWNRASVFQMVKKSEYREGLAKPYGSTPAVRRTSRRALRLLEVMETPGK